MNIFRRELRTNLRGLLIWSLSLALLNFWMVSIFPSMAADGAAMEEMMKAYPESMIKMFGMDKLNFTDPLGFYGVEAFFMVVLFGGIYGAILGSGILAKEEDEKTIEFLLAKPVSRGQVILEKTLAWVVYLVLFNVIIGAASWAGFAIFDVGEFSRVILFWMLLAPLFVHLVFASLGFVSALFFTRRRSALSVSIGLVLGLYFVNTAALLSEDLSFLGWFTPFRYMDAGEIFTNGAVNPLNALVLMTVAAVAVAATWMMYRRKDMTF